MKNFGLPNMGSHNAAAESIPHRARSVKLNLAATLLRAKIAFSVSAIPPDRKRTSERERAGYVLKLHKILKHIEEQ